MEKEGTTPTAVECVELIVPQRHVKRVKMALEERKLLNKKMPIVRHKTPTKQVEPDTVHMSISTNVPIAMGDSIQSELPMPFEHAHQALFKNLELEDIREEIKATSYFLPLDDQEPWRKNPLLKAVKASLDALPSELLDVLRTSVDALVEQFPSSYTIYRPMLLLPHNAYTETYGSTSSKALLFRSPDFQPFWQRVAASMGVTHIAVNAGIPLEATTFDDPTKNVDEIPVENVLRSPVNLTPVYGFFGPPPTAQTLSSPTASDFTNALWVQHTQNGIHQTWAPVYTMFSRGNIREKTRLLIHPSVTTSVAEPRGCTAVDLYAGIGYFVFSYKKAGVSKVLCWELNPWSIEGLQRGAALNGWRSQVIEPQSQPLDESRDLVIFAHSNEHALDDLAEMKRAVDLPPIRHVNCGFLPSSNLSWGTAVGMLDRETGGWIHAHENVGANDIEGRKAEVVTEMEDHLKSSGLRGVVRCEHVEKVKTYAPGVLHVVFDIWIGPTESVATS